MSRKVGSVPVNSSTRIEHPPPMGASDPSCLLGAIAPIIIALDKVHAPQRSIGSVFTYPLHDLHVFPLPKKHVQAHSRSVLIACGRR